MTTTLQQTRRVTMAPADVVAGIGVADRTILAAMLALFDETKLKQRARSWVEAGANEVHRRFGSEPESTDKDLEDQRRRWEASGHSDEELRVALYVRLRYALNLPVRLSATRSGCSHLADDIVARLIHLLDPPGLVKSGKGWLRESGWINEDEEALTLADVVVPILDEMLAQMPGESAKDADVEQRRARLVTHLEALSTGNALSENSAFDLHKANDMNDAALAKMLLVGGSWGALGVGVSAAGFSSYILAAQASAFVPFVSGPGLVSTVAVLSNPITVGAGTAGAIYWFGRRASRRVEAAIASQVVALLTILGLCSGRVSAECLLNAFAKVQTLDEGLSLPSRSVDQYQAEWTTLKAFWEEGVADLPDDVRRLTELRVKASLSGDSFGKDNSKRDEEATNAAAMSAMTIGDILYSVAAVDSTVIRAADFSRVAEISGPISFSHLASDILEGSEQSVLGGISQLKGYVAEKAVAAELAAAGHAVSFPPASNEPGYDLLVDGEPFQVKFHASTGGLTEHFSRYDYPVIANTELAGEVPDEWADRVFFVDGMSNDLVTQVTEESLHAGEDVLNPGVPQMAGLTGR